MCQKASDIKFLGFSQILVIIFLCVLPERSRLRVSDLSLSLTIHVLYS